MGDVEAWKVGEEEMRACRVGWGGWGRGGGGGVLVLRGGFRGLPVTGALELISWQG
jgi:hypothetical protein